MIPVCVFAKAPEPGKVKTRLISRLGETGSAQLASVMLQDIWLTVSSVPSVRPVLATVSMGVFPIAVEVENIWLQGNGDLGARLERIFQRGLQLAPIAIAIGADVPLLTASQLEEATKSLMHYDAVLGPTIDGGFYLLGLRRCPTGLLSDIPWSTKETGAATLCRLRSRELNVYQLPLNFDVDTPADLSLLGCALRKDRTTAPVTRAWGVASGLWEGSVDC